MRKEYRRAAREHFTREMNERWSQFEAVKIKSPVLFGGESVFRWVRSEALHCFVLLVPDAKGRQAFTVELAWSNRGRFPDAISRPTLMLGPEDPDPVDMAEGIIRLGDIANRKDQWWDFPDPAMERPGDLTALQESLEPMEASRALTLTAGPVEAAISLLAEAGMDFFEALANSQEH